MKSRFFVTGQNDMIFRSVGVLYRILIEEFRTFFLKGVILPHNAIFRSFWPVSVLHAYRLRFWTSLNGFYRGLLGEQPTVFAP